MELLVFRREQFDRLYNCQTLPNGYGTRRVDFGSVILSTGTFLTICYALCNTVIAKSELIKHSSYKLLLNTGIAHMLCLTVNFILTGCFSITAGSPCEDVPLKYTLGCIFTMTWTCQSASVAMLVLNRCVDLWKPCYIDRALTGKRIYFWICGCFALSFASFMLVPGVIFDSNRYGWFLVPQQVNHGFDRVQYGIVMFIVYNFLMSALLPLLYMFLIGSMWWKGRNGGASSSKAQILISVQAFCICAATALACFLYAYSQVADMSSITNEIVTVAVLTSNAMPVIMYITVNKTVRTGVIKLITRRKIGQSQSVSRVKQLTTTYERPARV